MAFSLVSESTSVAGTGSPESAALSISPVAGNALVVTLGQTNAAAGKLFTVSDNIGGTTGWTQAVLTTPNRGAGIWYKANVPAGITTVTIAATIAGSTFAASVAEFSGLGTAITVDASSSLNESPTTSTSHACSSAGVTSANDVLAVCAAVLTAAATECNPGTGYTETPASFAGTNILRQWREFASGCTSEVGAWSSTGTARVGVGAIALLSGNAVAAGNPWYAYLQQRMAR